MPTPLRIDASHQVIPTGDTYDGTTRVKGSSVVYASANKTLEVFEQCVHATTASVVITLPPVADALGLWYIISASQNINVYDQDDSYGWSDVSISAGNTRIFISNGIAWLRDLGSSAAT